MLGVKGGSWKPDRTDRRTENRKESRNQNNSYDNVGFRVIQVKNGEEPEKEVNLYTLDPIKLSAKISNNKIIISQEAITNAVEYQIFEYSEDTNLFSIVDRIEGTSYEINYTDENKNTDILFKPYIIGKFMIIYHMNILLNQLLKYYQNIKYFYYQFFSLFWWLK